MKELCGIYFSMQTMLFPVLEGEKIEISGKIKEFVKLIEADVRHTLAITVKQLFNMLV